MAWIWNEQFWLPINTTWDHLKSTETKQLPQFSDLKYSIVAGVVLLVLRVLTESFIFLPIGYFSGWMIRKKGLLSCIFSYMTSGFAGKSKFKRVAETAWRFTYYTSIWLIGMTIMIGQPQLYDVESCFRGWPNHNIPNTVWWYYIVETGFYWSLLISQILFDVKRSDYKQMLLHHIVTILLLSMSFTTNFVRVGTLILISHDCADIFLELGKLFRYAGWDRALTIDFCLLLFTWISTRLGYFPLHILRTMFFDAPPMVQENYRWENLLQRPIIPRVFLLMLCILLLLNIFWTYILIKIAVKSLSSGVDDIREDDSSGIEDSDEEKSGTIKKKKA